MGIVLHGIANCDTVKRARAHLAMRGAAFEFHDFKKLGVADVQLQAWVRALGWERLLNRQGSTWRKLAPEAQATVADAASAMRLMQAQPSSIKRPVMQWADGSFSVGFDAADWDRRLD